MLLFRRLVKLNGRQNAFDFLPVRLEPGRQLKGFAELFHWLVDGEAGRIGGQLKQNAARFTEVNGTEVAAIEYRRYVQVFAAEPPPPGPL